MTSSSSRTMDKQLGDLKGEIDAINLKIEKLEDKRENTADVTERAVILDSIKTLNARLEARSATRDQLLLNASAAPAPGKNTPLAFYVTPPLYMRTYRPPPLFFQCPSFFENFSNGSLGVASSMSFVITSCEVYCFVCCSEGVCCADAVDIPIFV